MKKKIRILALIALVSVLLCGCCLRHEWKKATCTNPKICTKCGKTEGEALGHDWEDATCTDPEICFRCDETRGEPLDHEWEEATTEAPKTCVNCDETEGERIITDERFTTAACKELFGTWETDADLTTEAMGLGYYDFTFPVRVSFTFENDGECSMSFEITDVEGFKESMVLYGTETAYEELEESYYMSREEIDRLFMEEEGGTVEDLVRETLTDEVFAELIEEIESTENGVYYVGDKGLYILDDWDEDDTDQKPKAFTVEGDTLKIDYLKELGIDSELTRVAE